MGVAESYSLRQVVELTGLSEFTLRGWESRYRAFLPSRNATGRRAYSTEDLKRAILLRELVNRKHRIGEVAKLPLGKLRELLGENSPALIAPLTASAEISYALRALSLQNWEKLEFLIKAAARNRNALELIRDFILPLIHAANGLISLGHLSISQEHILSCYLKELLHGLRAAAKKPSCKARILVAAPEGDHHELGILVAYVLAALQGAHCLYLGPNSPKGDLCETALRYGATHIIIGSTISRREGAAEDLPAYVHFLDKNLPKGAALWLGGRNANDFTYGLRRPLLQFGSLQELEAALKMLGDGKLAAPMAKGAK